MLNNALGVGSVANGDEGETDSSAASGPSAIESNANGGSHGVRNASGIVGVRGGNAAVVAP